LKASATPYNPQTFSSFSKGPNNQSLTDNANELKKTALPKSSVTIEPKSSTLIGAWGKAPSEAVRTAPSPSTAGAVTSQPQRPLPVPMTNQTTKMSKQKSSDLGKQEQQHKDQDKNKNSHHRHNDRHRTNPHSSMVEGNKNSGGNSYHGSDVRKGQQKVEKRDQESKSVAPDHHQKQGHGHHHHHPKNNQRSNHSNDPHQTQKSSSEQKDNEVEWKRGKQISDHLFIPGDGGSASQRAVKRIRVEDLLSLRLDLLDLRSGFIIPPLCIWNSPTRKIEICLIHNTPRHLGDVSAIGKKKNRKEPESANTEPPEDCKPLEVNDETRWKAKVFEGTTDKTSDEVVKDNLETDEAILKKALLILNKLSLTKFEKLSDDFITCGIGRNEKCLRGAIQLIVKKAQDEQHFSAMYASLCLKLAATPMDFDEGDDEKKGKRFKTMLLEECQKEFEQDTATKIHLATKDIEDNDEKRIVSDLVKKHYLGHMRFIGELYKGHMIKLKVMIYCLPALLENDKEIDGSAEDNGKSDIDEEKIECFSKLMATIGCSLEQQSEAQKSIGKFETSEKLQECWDRVDILAGRKSGQSPNVSTRIKFLLQDLVDLKNNRWVARRKEESAKTIAEIHMEAEGEMKPVLTSLQRSSSDVLRRQSSYGAFERPKPIVDADGYVEVQKAPFGRSRSMINIPITSTTTSMTVTKPNNPVSSKHAATDMMKISQVTKSLTISDVKKVSNDVKVQFSTESKDFRSSQKSTHEYVIKARAMFKDYFRSGDVYDAVISFDELLRGAEDFVARRVKITEISIMTVLEMRHDDVLKLLQFFSHCYYEGKIDTNSFKGGLAHPLEVLQDLTIDAPLAGRHMVTIVSELIRFQAITFDFLLNTPENFRMDGGAAKFGCDVVKTLGNGYVDSKLVLDIIDKLMTDEDREKFSSSQAMISA